MLKIKTFHILTIGNYISKDFIENYNQNSDAGYFLEVDVQYHKKLHGFQKDLTFMIETRKIEIVEKHVANLHSKKEYAIHIRNLKQPLNH